MEEFNKLLDELDSSFDRKHAQLDRLRLAKDEEREAEWYRIKQEASPVYEEDDVRWRTTKMRCWTSKKR